MSKPTEVPVSWTKDMGVKGEFKRQARSFRNWISSDGKSGFKAEKGRYHLYVSYACPWAHRTLLVRKLKGLEDAISYDVVDYLLQSSTGWSLKKLSPGATGDTVNGAEYLKEIYFKALPSYDSSFTVPVLWDKKENTIVNNESSEIIRMLNSEFNEFAKNPDLDLYPQDLRAKIDEVNDWVYPNINDGVYKCGFARSQEAYDIAVKNLFEHLDKVEDILKTNRYLTGGRLTEADIRLWTTLLRFDPVYATHFKCNKKRIIQYPNIWGFTREIYQMAGVEETVNMEHIKKHYYMSHIHINPFGIVPVGFDLDFKEPVNRDHLPKA